MVSEWLICWLKFEGDRSQFMLYAYSKGARVKGLKLEEVVKRDSEVEAGQRILVGRGSQAGSGGSRTR